MKRPLRGLPVPFTAPPDCDEVARVLQAYLDGELGAQDAEYVRDHLDHCDRCDIEATTVTRVIGAIRRQRPDLESERLERLAGFIDEITDEDRPPSS